MLPILCLFDIDGTLIKGSYGNKPTSPSLDFAFKEVFGIRDFNFIKYSEYRGITDLSIVMGVGKENGFAEELIKEKFDLFIDKAIEFLEKDKNNYQNKILPCAKTLVGVLSKKKVTCGILSGNAEKKAWWKLKACGFDKFIKFGAFGELSVKREDLFPIALERAQKLTGQKFEKQNIYIIGDTDNDIRVAKAHGVRSIGVATGMRKIEELIDAGADYVLPDFTKTKKFLEIIGIN